jgi:hypothetical protein
MIRAIDEECGLLEGSRGSAIQPWVGDRRCLFRRFGFRSPRRRRTAENDHAQPPGTGGLRGRLRLTTKANCGRCWLPPELRPDAGRRRSRNPVFAPSTRRAAREQSLSTAPELGHPEAIQVDGLSTCGNAPCMNHDSNRPIPESGTAPGRAVHETLPNGRAVRTGNDASPHSLHAKKGSRGSIRADFPS